MEKDRKNHFSDHRKNVLFWSNLHKIGVMITSLIEMQQLPNFGAITKSMK